MSQTETDTPMSSTQQTNDSSEDTRNRHEAVRAFASELNDATYDFKTSNSEMAPNYTLLPTGKRVNRIFVVGTLTDLEKQQTDDGILFQARVHDGNNYFYLSAGQYQQEATNVLRDIDYPSHVAIVAKLDHWETDDGGKRVQLTPEIISEVSSDDRKQWVIETAKQTRERIETLREAQSTDMQSLTPERQSDIDMVGENYPSETIDYSEYVNSAEESIKNVVGIDDD